MTVLLGKVALITGADSGIGSATAIEFAKEGADIVLNYLHDVEGIKRTAEAVRSAGRRALVVQTDVGDEPSVVSMFRSAIAEFERVDILVNSAGVDASGTKLADLELKDYESSLRTNLFGPFLCCREFVRARKALGVGGKIVNISSVHEEVARSGATDYCSAKGALRNLTRCLALEVAEEGINVNNIAPGMVLTPFNQTAIDDPKKLAEDTKSIPMKRAAESSEVARLAVFLASDASNYVTGSTYVMDGGLMQNQGQGA
jgi:glucose 1-dehydrogenase